MSKITLKQLPYAALILIGVRCTSMDGRLWRNRTLQESFSNIALRNKENFKSEKYDETRVLTKRTWRISKLPSSLPLKMLAFQCVVCVIYLSIADAFPPESREIPGQNELFNYNMTYGKVSPILLIAVLVWFSFKHSLWAWGIPFALGVVHRTVYDDA